MSEADGTGTGGRGGEKNHALGTCGWVTAGPPGEPAERVESVCLAENWSKSAN